MIQLDREWLTDGEPSAELLAQVLEQFEKERARLFALKAFYDGGHAIAERCRAKGAPNHRLWHDLPGYIVAMTSGYLVGEPVQYAAKTGFDELRDALRLSVAANVDSELATDAAIYGRGVEVYYADEQARPRLCQADARNAFVVYDDTVEHRPVFGVLLADKLDRHLKREAQRVNVYTDLWTIHYERKCAQLPCEVGRERHFFRNVPMTEFWNNGRERGDFEGVMNLIDAYDTLQSDRVNDKQQFTDALMVIYGATVEEEEAGGQRTLQQRLRETRTLEMPASDARVEYLTKTLSESDTEILKDSLKADIHKLSFVPDLTDREFAGNASGVAMEYKLFGLEQLTKVKERWFREGLLNRLRCLSSFLRLRGGDVAEAEDVNISFSRSLPVNRLEVAQTVKTYEGLVPKRLLLAQVPFVEDAEAAMREVEIG
ncbi:MAG: phage portal protein [Clostridia bacterium]